MNEIAITPKAAELWAEFCEENQVTQSEALELLIESFYGLSWTNIRYWEGGEDGDFVLLWEKLPGGGRPYSAQHGEDETILLENGLELDTSKIATTGKAEGIDTPTPVAMTFTRFCPVHAPHEPEE